MLGLTAVFLVAMPAPKSVAAACDAPVASEIACENSKAGTPQNVWDISGAGSSAIEGFATDISVNRGSTIGFKVKTTSSNYTMNIYRMGYYQGNGARLQATINVTKATTQPACNYTSGTGLLDCGNWTQTASWAVPSTAVSGVYFAHLISGGNENHIFFIVRNDASTSDLLFQTSDTTWQAYNSWGQTSANSKSLYTPTLDSRAYKVSYNRPFNTRAGSTSYDWVFSNEYPAIKYLEANGYDVSYTTGVDSDRRGSLIKNHKAFLSVGHDEYWSGGQRANVEAARDAGVNLAFWSGNEVFWKTRWESSTQSGDTYRTLVTYKETSTGTKIDPVANTWTGTWRDNRKSPASDGKPENALTGTIFTVNCCTTDMKVDGIDGQMRFWRNTRVANLTPSQDTTLGSGILGYEWDETPDNGYRPGGLIQLSTTSENVPSYLQDQGWNYAPGQATHHLTMYRAASGALVFGAGSVQWAWGLDDVHDNASNTADVAVQQATMNLLADMGAQPSTRQAGLVTASASTDTTAPTSTVTSPAAGSSIPVGVPTTITGTASDVGGKVGGVEVSTDNGASWHPADGRGTWSYTFSPGAQGNLVIKTRATDDSLRTETPGAGRTVTVGDGSGGSSDTCPCTIFAPTAKPTVASDPDGTALEIGVKFRTTKAGDVTGVRFYKGGSNNNGTHTGSLWSASGTRLATGTFTGESASGWQQLVFANPVAINANTTYVVSYYAPNGHYAADDGYFTSAVGNSKIMALADGTDGVNGVYKTGAGFPTQAYAKSNYWVDAIFTDGATTDTTKPTLTSTAPADGASGVAVSTTISATFSEAVQSSTVAMSVKNAAGTAVAGSTAYDTASRTATFTPSAALATGTTYTATVTGAKDTAGNQMDAASWSFGTAAADTTAPTVTGRTPASGATNVANSTVVSATFSEAVVASSASIAVTKAGAAVAGSLAYDSATRTATFTPSTALTASTAYSVTVSGAKDAANNTMTAVTWSFTTAAASTDSSFWTTSTVPATASEDDPSAAELGLKFKSSVAGKLKGIRVYHGPGMTQSHSATLWSSTGTKLGTATVPAGSGWQTATLATPVALTAGTTYVVSYFASAGHYPVNSGYFTAAYTSKTLTAPVNAGVYKYSATSVFPTTAYQASNYWVDVVFAPN